MTSSLARFGKCSKGPCQYFLLHNGFLVKDNLLCIYNCSLSFAIIKEVHGGGHHGHFGREDFITSPRALLLASHMS